MIRTKLENPDLVLAGFFLLRDRHIFILLAYQTQLILCKYRSCFYIAVQIILGRAKTQVLCIIDPFVIPTLQLAILRVQSGMTTDRWLFLSTFSLLNFRQHYVLRI